MKISQSELKEIYSSYLKERNFDLCESCPSNEDLLLWLRSKLPKKEKNEITDHIVICYNCSQEVKWILDQIRKEDRIIYEIKKSIDTSNAERHQKSPDPQRRLSWKIVSFASTLALLAAIGFFSVSYFSPKPYFRGGVSFVITPVSPINKSIKANELKFVWKGPPNMKYCFIEVFDSSLYLLWQSGTILRHEVIPSNDLSQKLTPEEAYFWMVTGVFEGGNKVKSRLIKFKIF